VTGEVEKEDNVLIIKRIFVTYHLKLADDHRDTAQRVHGFHADYCPVARSIGNCIDIQTELIMESLQA
jgi:organic hydroperoxide reductase OsmC/OhrA